LPLSISKRRNIEFRLCCFAAWLRRASPPLASGTIAGYVGHVRSRHSLWMDGTAFAELVGSTRRLTLMLRALKKQHPPAKRKKRKFNIRLIQKWYTANFDFVHSSSAASFEFTRDLLVMVFSFYQLCRLSELMNTSPPSQANANPVLRSDLRFFSSDHKQLEEPPQWWRQVAYIRCRYPPSKVDPFSFNSDVFFPKQDPTAPCMSVFEIIRLFIVLYPIDPCYHSVTPLIHASMDLPSRQVSDRAFLVGFKQGCRAAAIDGSKYGKHCFRVAGMNRLAERDAGPVVISAHGHWASDAWGDYSRMHSATLMKWVSKMAGAILYTRSPHHPQPNGSAVHVSPSNGDTTVATESGFAYKPSSLTCTRRLQLRQFDITTATGFTP
jgi:hypothetical protein